jgi:hypothetical protein
MARPSGGSEKKLSKAMHICDEQDIEEVDDLRMLFDADKLSGVGFSEIITQRIAAALKQGKATNEKLETATSHGSAVTKTESPATPPQLQATKTESPATPPQLQAFLQDASLGPIAKAVIKAFHPIYSDDLAALKEASSRADELFAEILPLTNVPTQPDYGSFAGDALAQAKDVKFNFPTVVLASVKAPCWWWSYVTNLVLFMVKSVAVANSITLLAVKGGPYSDAEITFVQELLPLVGAVLVRAGHRPDGKTLTWAWEITRSGSASACEVVLVQYQQAADATDLAQMFQPSEEHASAPVREGDECHAKREASCVCLCM